MDPGPGRAVQDGDGHRAGHGVAGPDVLALSPEENALGPARLDELVDVPGAFPVPDEGRLRGLAGRGPGPHGFPADHVLPGQENADVDGLFGRIGRDPFIDRDGIARLFVIAGDDRRELDDGQIDRQVRVLLVGETGLREEREIIAFSDRVVPGPAREAGPVRGGRRRQGPGDRAAGGLRVDVELVGPDRVLDHPAGLEEPGRKIPVHQPLVSAGADAADGAGAPLGPGLDVTRRDRPAVFFEHGPDGPVEGGLREPGQVCRGKVQGLEHRPDDVLRRLCTLGAGRGDEISEASADLPAGVVRDGLLGEERCVAAGQLGPDGVGRRVARRRGRGGTGKDDRYENYQGQRGNGRPAL